MTDRLQAIVALLEQQQVVLANGQLDLDARLRRDLHLDNDRAQSFINEFALKFEIDMRAFRQRRFFSVYELDLGPPFLDLTWLIRWLNKDFARAWWAVDKYEISVSHLLAVIEKRVWFDPAPEQHTNVRVTDDPNNRLTRRIVDVTWTIVTLPHRVLGLVAVLISFAMLAFCIWGVTRELMSESWSQATEALVAAGLPATHLFVAAYITAKRIQHRFGDQHPRDVLRRLDAD